MSATMTKKRPKRGEQEQPPELPPVEAAPPERTAPGRPVSRRSGKPVQVYLSDELSEALDLFIERARPRPTKTAVIEMALEDLLRKAGILPPPQN